MKNNLNKIGLFVLGILVLGISISFKTIGNVPPTGTCKAAAQKCVDIPGPFDPKGLLVVVID